PGEAHRRLAMVMTDEKGTYAFRPAEASDAPAAARLVDAAYRHYVDRIGMLPGPMTENYAEVIRDHQVTVVECDRAVVGVLVLAVTDEGFLSTTSPFTRPVAGPGWAGRS